MKTTHIRVYPDDKKTIDAIAIAMTRRSGKPKTTADAICNFLTILGYKAPLPKPIRPTNAALLDLAAEVRATEKELMDR
jgi:hypothetical protein